ncbi:MAG: FAD-dependent oxidoreductase [Caldimonas sp.]
MSAAMTMGAPVVHDGYAVAVIGAGPAGLVAATRCARAGLATVLFDEQAAAGGQIYRGVTESPLKDRSVLGADYWAGESLARDFVASGAQYLSAATVWSLTPEREIGVSVGGGSTLTQARRVVVATGALERPFPVPGWTLPGVMTAGAAQTMLKSSAMVPDGRTVLAGSGPLLWLLAWQFLNAGGKIDAILDTTPSANRKAARPHVGGFLHSPYLSKGLKLLWAVRRRVRVIGNVTDIRAEGEGRLASVVYRVGGSPDTMRLDVDNLLLHQGVVPNVNLAMSVGIAHHWNEVQACWTPTLDAEGASSIDGIFVAGDGAGIAGAEAAAARGAVAASRIVRELRPEALRADAGRDIATLARYSRGRSFLDHLYRPAKAFRVPTGDTIVCRCEEVTARQIVDAVAIGCPGPNQLKSFLRCGMGPCQGRLCGLTVTEVIADARGVPPEEVGYYRIRPPVKPITVAELAALPKSDAAVKAVVRV